MSSTEKRYLLVLLHFVFFASGISTVLIGQVLPLLSAGFALNDLQASLFFPSQFAGSIAGTLLTSWLGGRGRFLLATAAGCASMAAGITAMNLTSFEGALAGFFVNGFGIGLTLPAINMLVLEMNEHRGASSLSVLNFCWGVGAIVCKPFVDATATRGSIFVTSLLLAVPLLMGAALVALFPAPQERARAVKGEIPQQSPPIWTTALAWAIAFFNFVHVGFESGMGGWMTTFADRVHGEPVVQLTSPTFLYFLFFVVGRGIAPVYFRFLSENQVLLLDLGLMLAGLLLIVTAGNLVWLMAGAALAGFGTSSVFPTNLARFTATFGPTASRRAAPLFICGTLGASAVTSLIGYISNRTGNLQSGMYALLVCVLVLLAIQVALYARAVSRTAQASNGTAPPETAGL